MQFDHKEKDALEHGAPHSTMETSQITMEQDPSSPPESEWISEMPPHIRRKADEWIEYFVEEEFGEERTWEAKLSEIISFVCQKPTFHINFLPIYLGVIISLVVIAMHMSLTSLSTKWQIFIIINIAVLSSISFLLKARKFTIEILTEDGIDSKFQKHRVKASLFNASEHFKDGRYLQAHRLYQGIVDEHGNVWIARYYAAMCLSSLGQKEEAIQSFNKLIEELKDEVFFKQKNFFIGSSYNQLGNIMETMACFSEAYNMFKKALVYLPDYYVLHINLLIVCVKMHKFGEARQWFQKLNEDKRSNIPNLLSREEYIHLHRVA